MAIIGKALLIDKDHNYTTGYKSIIEHEDELVDVSEFCDSSATGDPTLTGTFGNIIKDGLVYHVIKCFWDLNKKIRYFIAKCEYSPYDDPTPTPDPPEPEPPAPSPEEIHATVNGISYKTVEEAITAAAENGGMVRLTQDTTINTTTTIASDKTVSINLCGKTLETNKPQARCLFNNGTLRLSNGTIKNTDINSYGVVDNSKNSPATLVLENMTIEDNGNGDGASIVDRGGGTVILKNCTIKSLNDGDAGNACVTVNTNSKVVIDDCNFVCNSGISSHGGCYGLICRGADVTINNCNFETAKGGIAIDYGKVVINNCIVKTDVYYAIWVTNNSDLTDVTINGSIFSGKRYGLYASIDDNKQDMGDVNIVINNGQFFGETKAAAAINPKGSEKAWALAINGGVFNSDISIYLDEFHEQLPNGAVVLKR